MKHPYVGLPDRQFWKKEPGVLEAERLDPVSPPPFKIDPDDRIVTAGSCFAQHVARFMSNSGFNHHITERAHPLIAQPIASRHNYGMFAARYGNIYTARQLKQLFERAYGTFQPQAFSWPSSNVAGVVDPFRPQIQPGGYLSDAELEADRESHFAAIRRAIEEMDVFVFTLGLTEAWVDTRDGAVFPIAPGVAGGSYDPETVAFKNFDDDEVYADMADALTFLREKRPDLRIILTVSPVPLNATFEDRHVLTSTVYSKAVLRVAAERCTKAFDNCVYFPSFDIITAPHVRGRYFDTDCREVLPAGVEHVMRLFLKHFTEGADPSREPRPSSDEADRVEAHLRDMQEKMDVLCDEAAIDNR
ncbi:GSCFA domain-containing protein [Paracoccus sp. TK19116]|uniref:GSCFA domain-containing protein n=1 Tax=Paracoccus albicereus TaxID=2922394 RepID=A0ABT1MMU4_9RHOB|nr:GSCFA domain-containing protein [Paracoccus albicereus]MCQ0969600.1 GSCFA domain-containing protein [Paracoccus albicereus]